MEKYYLGILQNSPGLNSAKLRRLLNLWGTAEAVWKARVADITKACILDDSSKEAFLAFRKTNEDLPYSLAEKCESQHISICDINDDVYPKNLKEIFDPPYVLFYRGTLQNDKLRIAIVGSRKISPYGRAAAKQFSVDLASLGVSVVSGAAYGVDTESHKGALSAGTTEAVLGCGIDVVYPTSNKKLLADIAEKGAVISEYLPGTPPLKHNFPARNRIISGMARGVLVVEAAERSGSLITAELALSVGRDIFAVPGSIFAPGSLGCNKLIQQGAKLVLDTRDIMSEYSDIIKVKTLSEKNGNMERNFSLSGDEERVYSLLSPDIPMSIDEIIYKLHGSDPANVAFLLLQMEFKGLIQSDESNLYVKK
ncbi:MAG: DNA-processing protein DprA [Anaerovibrio sp.]|uniref:DNA-processing protein DprA n=1 Tax=Anaerovibrio sp. TaxID=1872532 RepID=UPI0025ECD8C9|nr:DNA-processing protein DprA [Anaerovibrio sp.]MCR5175891.1 DNA-processing protein DprA [Anaerovibrio sp.]